MYKQKPHLWSRLPASYYVLLFLIPLFPLIGFTQTAPDLGSAAGFSILSGSEFNTLEDVRVLSGKVGIEGAKRGVIRYAKDAVLPTHDRQISSALSDLENARQNMTQMNGTSLSGALDGVQLKEGVYHITGNATLNGMCILSGDESSLFMINITGDLTLNAERQIHLDGVLPQNVYWNIGGDLNMQTGSQLSGVILANGNISIQNYAKGTLSLLANGKITMPNSVFVMDHTLMSTTTLAAITQDYGDDIVDEVANLQGGGGGGGGGGPLPEISSPTGDCDESSPDWDYYNDRDIYELETNFNIDVPIKVIPVNFHIFQDDNGNGSWQNNATDLARLQQIIDWANNFYEHNRIPSDPISAYCNCNDCDVDCRIPDTKIRFELNTTEFYQDDPLYCTSSVTQMRTAAFAANPDFADQFNVYWSTGRYSGKVSSITMTNGGSGYTSVPTVSISGSATGTAVVSGGVVTDIIVNNQGSYFGCPPTITITGGGGSGATAEPDMCCGASGYANLASYNIDQNSHVMMFNNGANPVGDYATAGTLAHEWGHNLGLCHTYLGGGCATTCSGMISGGHWYSDIFGDPSPGNCPHLAGWGVSAHDNTIPDGDKYTNNTLGGNQSTGYLSPRQISNVHRTMALKGPRRVVNNCPYSSTPLTISGSEHWDFDIRIYRDIVIEDDADLTISCRVVMSEDAKIIVKPGGKLTIDGGVVTTRCYHFWKGIEVWGDINESQYPSSDPPQGWLVIRNGGLIENARAAVRLWKLGDYSTTGGIVQATDAIFRNNKRDVEFISYDNFLPWNPGTVYNNRSYFTGCQFITDQELLDGEDLFPHVTMWQVEGINFRGCTFENTTTGIFNYNARGKGILAVDSKFYVTPRCTSATFPCPSTSMVPNHFQGLYRGIEISGCANPLAKARIQGNDFIDNYQGIYANGIMAPEIHENTFEIGEIATLTEVPYGIYLNSNDAYEVEANSFLPYGNAFGTIGAYIANSNVWGDVSNQIYGNNFTDLFAGTIALEDNDGTQVQDGLVIKCNKYQGNGYDIAVIDGDISLFQGLCNNQSSPAGNQFSHTCSGAENDIYVDKTSTQNIFYFHHSSVSTTPQCYDPLVLPSNCGIVLNENAACPPLNTGCTGWPCKEVALAQAEVAELDAFRNLGGADPIAVADALQQRVQGGRGRGLVLTQLEEQVLDWAGKVKEKEIIIDEMIYFVTDEEPAPYSDLIAVLENEQTEAAQIALLPLYEAAGEYQRADALLSTLARKSHLRSYVELHTVLLELAQNQRNLFQMSSSQKQTISQVAADEGAAGCAQAKGIMEFVFEEAYEVRTPYPGSSPTKQTIEAEALAEANGGMDLFPNPTSGELNIEYVLPEHTEIAQIEIRDMVGRKLNQIELNESSGKLVHSLSAMPEGIYFFVLKVDNAAVQTQKIVVAR